MKRKFDVPLVFLADASINEQGPGSAIGGLSLKPVPMSFGEWAQTRWCADYDSNGEVTADDYAKWWAQSGLGSDMWLQFNPDVPWNDEWSR